MWPVSCVRTAKCYLYIFVAVLKGAITLQVWRCQILTVHLAVCHMVNVY